MSVAINGQPLWPAEIAGPVAATAEHAEEVSFRVEHLDAVVDRVRDKDVALGIDRDICGPRKSSGIFLAGLLGRAANRALELEGVGVKNGDVILDDVGDVKKPVPGVQGNAAGTLQRILTERCDQAVRRIEHENRPQVRIADKKTIVVINRKTDDLLEMNFLPVVDKADLLHFRVENEDGSNIGVCDVDVALGIDGDPVRFYEYVWVRSLDLVDLSFTGQTIHPFLLLLCGGGGGGGSGFAFELGKPAD